MQQEIRRDERQDEQITLYEQQTHTSVYWPGREIYTGDRGEVMKKMERYMLFACEPRADIWVNSFYTVSFLEKELRRNQIMLSLICERKETNLTKDVCAFVHNLYSKFMSVGPASEVEFELPQEALVHCETCEICKEFKVTENARLYGKYVDRGDKYNFLVSLPIKKAVHACQVWFSLYTSQHWETIRKYCKIHCVEYDQIFRVSQRCLKPGHYGGFIAVDNSVFLSTLAVKLSAGFKRVEFE